MSWDRTTQTITAILAEKQRAEQKFPKWPNYQTEAGRIEIAAIIAEEAGEIVKEALDMRGVTSYKPDMRHFRDELIQTAAMCIRALEGLPEPKLADDEEEV